MKGSSTEDRVGSGGITLVAGKCADANGDGLVNEADRKLLPPTAVVENAHKAGLLVHPFTFRNEQRRLASDFKGNPVNEYLAFYELGVDGLFADFPDTAVTARALWALKRDPDAAKCLVQGRWQPGCKGLRWLNAN